MSHDSVTDVLTCDASQGPTTEPGPEAHELSGLPGDLPGLTRVVQGLLFHYLADEAIFGWQPPRARIAEIDTRHASARPARLAPLDASPLIEPRPPRIAW